MSKKIDDARELIAKRLREIETETVGLERALKGMGGDVDRRPRPEVGGKRPRRKRRRRMAPPGQRREQLLAAVKANPGARPVELARAIGVSPGQLHGVIAKARRDKLIVKKNAGYALKK